MRSLAHCPSTSLARRTSTVAVRSASRSLVIAWGTSPGHGSPAQATFSAASIYTGAGPIALSSTTTTAGLSGESLPTHLARLIVGAALALSTVYTLLSASTTVATGVAFGEAASAVSSPPLPTAPSSTSSADTPFVSALPILRTPEQFDAFVLAANRAGYLAIVLFHAPWCNASARMETELQRLSHLFLGRRVVFGRVNCHVAVKQGGIARLGQLPAVATTGATTQQQGEQQEEAAWRGAVPSTQPLRLGLQRCDLTQLHRIHKTPTVRMYFNNACVDEVIGCRPVEFRQAASDLTFKFKL